MRKKIKHLPPGTFIDTGSLKKGGEASFILPDGRLIRTTAIERVFLVENHVEVETKNTVYVKK